MSLPNHNYDSSNCLKHLEQLVIRTTQLEHSIHLSDSFNGYSCVPNNTVVLFGENRQRNSTLLPDLSDGSNVMGQVSEVNPLPITSTGINTQFSVHSTSSIYSIQHVTQNQIPLQPWERNIDLISSSSYNMYDAIERSGTNNYCDSSNCLDELEQLVNRTTQSSQPSETGLCSMFTKSENRQTNKKNKTSSRQTVARVGNIFNEAENQVVTKSIASPVSYSTNVTFLDAEEPSIGHQFYEFISKRTAQPSRSYALGIRVTANSNEKEN
ncbi:uncharacterized protein LOC131662938 isoform X4 [Phymastichus coffea]|nr:uncharacterized protein LOC131662938 isoform X4 [Phymastichus coffea]